MPTLRNLAIALSLTAFAAPILAQPPAHAPAHGWRKKNDPHYVGYTGYKWSCRCIPSNDSRPTI